MTTAKTTAPATANGVAPHPQDAAPIDQHHPYWNFLPDPEPVEDAMQQLPTINRINPMIEGHFQNRPDVLVTGEAYLCWDPTNKNAKLSPDCMVAIGINPQDVELKNGYLIWEIGKPPDVVIEVASERTARADLTRKRARYASLGIAEYWRLDPSGGDRYGEPLVGEYLADGEYRRIGLHRGDDGLVWARSPVMGINLRWDGRHFATQDPVTGRTMLGLVEANETIVRMEREYEAERQAAEAREAQERAGRLQERAAREAAQAETAQEREARLQERDAWLQEREARLQERAARESAEADAAQEREARESANAEIAELRDQLRRWRNQ